MKKICLLSVCFVLLLSTGAFAEAKIGVLNAKLVITKSLYGKDVAEKLKAKYHARGEELKKEKDALEKLKMQIESKAFDDNTAKEKIIELRRRGRDFSEDMNVYQRSVQQDEIKMTKPILERLEKVIMDYCTAKGFSIVIDRSVTPGLVYTADGLDITKPITAELDKMKKAGK